MLSRGPKPLANLQSIFRDLKSSDICEMLFAHLVQVDNRLPELIIDLVEVSHAHFSEVAGMVFVEICSMVMLPTRHTTSTRMLSVLANAAVTSGDMAAAGRKSVLAM